jgi:KipI family sensor histidine kinase inhibitor
MGETSLQTWRWVGDRAILREFPGDCLARRNESARALYDRLRERRLADVEDVVPAAASVLVLLRTGAKPPPDLLSALENAELAPHAAAAREPRVHEIEVAYGGDAGPDLADLARLHALDDRIVVELHVSIQYTVGFLGFSPGFAYLIGLPAALATPRLATPRTRVPAGSVAVGGEFTGIYPRATPGGWRILGRTGVSLFDPNANPPTRLLPGDRVKFVAR